MLPPVGTFLRRTYGLPGPPAPFRRSPVPAETSGFSPRTLWGASYDTAIRLNHRVEGSSPPRRSTMTAKLRFSHGCCGALAALLATLVTAQVHAEPDPSEARRPAGDAELRIWLENMVWYHGFSTAEITA